MVDLVFPSDGAIYNFKKWKTLFNGASAGLKQQNIGSKRAKNKFVGADGAVADIHDIVDNSIYSHASINSTIFRASSMNFRKKLVRKGNKRAKHNTSYLSENELLATFENDTGNNFGPSSSIAGGNVNSSQETKNYLDFRGFDEVTAVKNYDLVRNNNDSDDKIGNNRPSSPQDSFIEFYEQDIELDLGNSRTNHPGANTISLTSSSHLHRNKTTNDVQKHKNQLSRNKTNPNSSVDISDFGTQNYHSHTSTWHANRNSTYSLAKTKGNLENGSTHNIYIDSIGITSSENFNYPEESNGTYENYSNINLVDMDKQRPLPVPKKLILSKPTHRNSNIDALINPKDSKKPVPSNTRLSKEPKLTKINPLNVHKAPKSKFAEFDDFPTPLVPDISGTVSRDMNSYESQSHEAITKSKSNHQSSLSNQLQMKSKHVIRNSSSVKISESSSSNNNNNNNKIDDSSRVDSRKMSDAGGEAVYVDQKLQDEISKISKALDEEFYFD
ncbi:hypothetical protein AYI70_g3779 [Smittium culicis]|uniref:Uncharacterized protein n=1 Tax=Smittium culicis TaxID=133412 RepID=A0A1R1Y201_9FUNG|nr:hypothetical protein AYI70_g3779 [Smittium culicis]